MPSRPASQLKAWIDHLAVAGKTFRYTSSGSEGLVSGKRVLVASGRGGVYSPGGPMAASDFQEPYLAAVFRLLGIEDVEFVRAEGVALGPDHREASIAQALASVPATVARVATALAA